MPLPTIVTPSYTLELPSTGQEIEYRPFLVKEEKLLILALETEDSTQITKAITTVLENCVLTKDIKISSLPTFDIEYIFLNVRGQSVGEEIELEVICPDDEETKVKKNIPIADIKVVKRDDHKKRIEISDTLMIEMKYPSLSQFVKGNFGTEDLGMDTSFDLIAECVDKIYTTDEVWDCNDVTKEEIISFIEQMNSSQFKQIEKFFETMPKLTYELHVTNPKTKKKSKLTLEGLSSFFA